jgi:hypothetical protein
MEKLIIAGREFNSRLFLGTGKFPNNTLMQQAILASETEMVTVAMKRVDLNDKDDDLLNHILNPSIQLLPNTSGVRNAEEAVFAAQMAREAFGTNWLKLEIHPDPKNEKIRSTARMCFFHLQNVANLNIHKITVLLVYYSIKVAIKSTACRCISSILQELHIIKTLVLYIIKPTEMHT